MNWNYLHIAKILNQIYLESGTEVASHTEIKQQNIKIIKQIKIKGNKQFEI